MRMGICGWDNYKMILLLCSGYFSRTGFGDAIIFRHDGDIVGVLIPEPSLSTIPCLPFAYAGSEL